MNSVLIHNCFQALSPFALSVGKEKIFHANPNVRCSCVSRINYHDRDEKLQHGEIFVIAHRSSNGYFIPEWREVVIARKSNGPTWWQPIDEFSVTDAYVEGIQYQQDRILTYGAMRERFFGCLMGHVKQFAS